MLNTTQVKNYKIYKSCSKGNFVTNSLVALATSYAALLISFVYSLEHTLTKYSVAVDKSLSIKHTLSSSHFWK